VLHRTYPVAWGKGTAPKNLRSRAGDRGRGADRAQAGFEAGLLGLSVGQAIQVLYWVDRGQRDLIVQSPRHTDGPRGVFALRSPVRPNPIALGTVVITSIDGNTIGIDATDAWDGTPGSRHQTVDSHRRCPTRLAPGGLSAYMPSPWPRHPTIRTTR
jgi:hypothetical protein